MNMNKTTTWTPGPWRAVGWETNKRHHFMRWVVSSGDCNPVCDCGKRDMSGVDARLIALAPEMAEVLRESVASADHYGADTIQEPWLKKARALLSRLEGGQS